MRRAATTTSLISVVIAVAGTALLVERARVRALVRARPLSACHAPLQDGSVPHTLLTGIVAQEDVRFFDHSGLDTSELKTSFIDNLRSARLLRGGSTIDMQVAALCYFPDGPRPLRKLRQLFATPVLSERNTKEEILAAYVAMAPVGPQNASPGFSAASQAYFGKPLLDLDYREEWSLILALRHRELFSPTRTDALKRPLARRYQVGLHQAARRQVDLDALIRSKLPRLAFATARAESFYFAGDSAVDVAGFIARAAQEFHLAPHLLLAIAYADTRLSLRSAPKQQSSWIALRRSIAPRSPASVAKQLGIDADTIDRSPALGIRAAAALIDKHATALKIDRDKPEQFIPLLETFSNVEPLADRLYAQQVFTLWQGGFSATDDAARPITVPKLPTFIPPTAIALPVPAKSPTQRAITHIVLHTTEAPFSATLAAMRGKSATASAHYLIRAHDGLTIQLHDDQKLVHHDACFDEHSIGIEHEGFTTDGARWYSPAMYAASAELIRTLAERHHIPLDRAHILGHSETPDCSDHFDPGPTWDWDTLMHLIDKK